MLAFVLTMFMVMGVCISTIGFIVWALNEHRLANKYRELVRLSQMMPRAAAPINKVAGNAWEVTFKEKGKLRKVSITGNSESEVIRQFSKSHDVYRIESIEKK